MSEMKTALLFPGQGAQDMGMGRALAERNPEIMELWKQAERISRIPLRGIYWESGENMDDTRRLQPALTVVNVSLWMELSRKVKPAGTAGHSLGEYSALVAASVLPVNKVLELVTLRGSLMASADSEGRGGMAAIVKLQQPQAEELIAAVRAECTESEDVQLRIANYNTPVQFVASGTQKAVALLADKAKEFKGRAIPLAVSGAFHSPMMAEAAKEMGKALELCSFENPRFPVYCNVTGKAAYDADSVKALLLAQMTSSVRWIDTVRNMYADGMCCFMECGPKNILGKMVEPILSGTAEEGSYTVTSVTSPEDLQALG